MTDTELKPISPGVYRLKSAGGERALEVFPHDLDKPRIGIIEAGQVFAVPTGKLELLQNVRMGTERTGIRVVLTQKDTSKVGYILVYSQEDLDCLNLVRLID